MKKLEYLKLAMRHGVYRHRGWVITAFSITKEKEIKKKYPYMLLVKPWGYSFLDEGFEEIKIDDSVPNQPLFIFKETIIIDPSWIDNLKDKIETSIGRLLFNYFCLVNTFGPKLPYQNAKPTSVSKIEEIIAPRLKSTPEKESDRSNQYFYCDEKIKFDDALQDFSTLSQLAAWSATRKAIIAPTGIKEFKAAALKRYEGKLNDPVEVSKLEGELKAFDDAFLKDDPAYGTFLAGKITNQSRKKLYLMAGNELGFGDPLKSNTVTNSLHEGIPTDPVQFARAMNGSRAGSFSRGSETVKGGVSAKYLLRSANNFIIEDKDCGVKYGITLEFDQFNIRTLVGRYIIEGNKTTLVENKEAAANYLGKVLKVRSPMYCKLNGEHLCRICSGENLFRYPKGLTIPLTEISAAILIASLKVMHTSGTSTAKLNLAKSLT